MLERATLQLARLDEEILREQTRITKAIQDAREGVALGEGYWKYLHLLVANRTALSNAIKAVEGALADDLSQ